MIKQHTILQNFNENPNNRHSGWDGSKHNIDNNLARAQQDNNNKNEQIAKLNEELTQMKARLDQQNEQIKKLIAIMTNKFELDITGELQIHNCRASDNNLTHAYNVNTKISEKTHQENEKSNHNDNNGTTPKLNNETTNGMSPQS